MTTGAPAVRTYTLQVISEFRRYPDPVKSGHPFCLQAGPRTPLLASLRAPRISAGSRQIHFRFLHTRRTGRSPEGRSRIWVTERPWPTARTPQLPHPTMLVLVSTEMKGSPSCSIMAKTTNPSRFTYPTTRSRRYYRHSSPVPPVSLVLATARIGDHGASVVNAYGRVTGKHRLRLIEKSP